MEWLLVLTFIVQLYARINIFLNTFRNLMKPTNSDLADLGSSSCHHLTFETTRRAYLSTGLTQIVLNSFKKLWLLTEVLCLK